MAQRKRFTRADLTDNQAAWLDRYIEYGASREAATRAIIDVYGYDPRPASAAATRMLKNEKIQDVIVEEAGASFAALGLVATERLADILLTGQWFGQTVKPSDGLKAIKEGIDRGVGPLAHIQKIQMEGEINVGSAKELRAQIIQEMAKLSVSDKQVLLSQFPDVMESIQDAEFEEIEQLDPEAPWGRRKDGTPCAKPGRPVEEKRVLPGPDAYKPEIVSDLEKRKRVLKEKAMKRIKEATGAGS